MSEAESLYHQIASGIPGISKGKMFGALCLKAGNGKAGVMFWKDDMVFKLDPETMNEVLSLDGTRIFEPAPRRLMNGWVQVPFSLSERWEGLAEKAMDFVK